LIFGGVVITFPHLIKGIFYDIINFGRFFSSDAHRHNILWLRVHHEVNQTRGPKGY
jgi:phage head maturation protease